MGTIIITKVHAFQNFMKLLRIVPKNVSFNVELDIPSLDSKTIASILKESLNKKVPIEGSISLKLQTKDPDVEPFKKIRRDIIHEWKRSVQVKIILLKQVNYLNTTYIRANENNDLLDPSEKSWPWYARDFVPKDLSLEDYWPLSDVERDNEGF